MVPCNTSSMAQTEPRFGEQVMSWPNVWSDLYPDLAFDPHDDAIAISMHRLRGLVIAQATEVEDVLGAILDHLDPSDAGRRRTAGNRLWEIKARLNARDRDGWADTLDLLDHAVKSRNHASHNTVKIGSSWRDYATGDGGEWVPVVSTMGGELYDEQDLQRDLALQQEATVEAVRLLHYLRGSRASRRL
jgi:hypothetical protein